ncbi:MAG TPA: metallophosphoesterase [Vicinamibacterales bacterium]|nr:metallophosphoesterase [Vicinamibacterales bacterium]
MRLAWLTDLHLDFLDHETKVVAFFDRVAASGADAVLVGGDVATAPKLERHLTLLERAVRRPIYFVLGNHDFYGSSIVKVRDAVRALCGRSTWLHWLSEAGFVPLGDETGLIGHDSWADGRFGNGSRSQLLLNDFLYIEEFQGRTRQQWYETLASLGDEAAAYFREALPEALDQRAHVLLLTHVPPFREASWHRGKISDDEGLPLFACKAVGEVLREIMQRRPDRRLTVLCGHTHSAGVAQILPNLEVRTGHATYGAPCIQDVIDV